MTLVILSSKIPSNSEGNHKKTIIMDHDFAKSNLLSKYMTEKWDRRDQKWGSMGNDEE